MNILIYSVIILNLWYTKYIGDLMNIKFPKEITRKIEEIKEVVHQKQYGKVLNYYDEIIENANLINNINQTLITEYIDILFEMRLFEKIISFYDGCTIYLCILYSSFGRKNGCNC